MLLETIVASSLIELIKSKVRTKKRWLTQLYLFTISKLLSVCCMAPLRIESTFLSLTSNKRKEREEERDGGSGRGEFDSGKHF